MQLSDTCDKITITKGVLFADCKKADKKTTVHSSISLNDYIGNVDGKLTWGGRGFSHSAEDIRVNSGILSAKIKSGGKLVESTLDLNVYIENQDGNLSVIPSPSAADANKKLVAPELSRGVSEASVASVASAASASSVLSASSSTSMATSVSTSSVSKMTSSSSSSATFSSSQFRSQSKYLLIEETCTKLGLRGTFLHAECQRLDGKAVHASIDLDAIIGFVDGRLEWDHSSFSKHSFEYSLDGFFLVVKYKVNAKGDEHRIARLDLRTRLRNANGVIVLIELNKKLSVMLSEVPWMKFKVIAEPDLSVFAKHPVMQETLVRIAETTVEHVTVEMHKMLTIAMETAITAITASAMKHVSAQMQTLVSDAVGYASASASITAAESLHLYGRGRFSGGIELNGEGAGYAYGDGVVYANGGGAGYANGRVSYGHSSSGVNEYSAHYESSGSTHINGDSHYEMGDSHSYAEIAKHPQVAHV